MLRPQAAPELLATERRGTGNQRSMPFVTGGLAHPQDGSLTSADEVVLPGSLKDIFAATSPPGGAASAAFKMRGSMQAAESPQAHGVAKDDAGRVLFSEAFWSVPEWQAPAGNGLPPEEAAPARQALTAWPETMGLDAVVSDTLSWPAERPSGGQNHMQEQVAQSDSTAGQLNVANSVIRALQDLVLSMQVQLREAHVQHSAVSAQLGHVSAHLQHLQRAQQAWGPDLALQAALPDAGALGGAEVQDADAAQLQAMEDALHQALDHELQLMAQVIDLQPAAAAVSRIEPDVTWLSATAGGDIAPEAMQQAAKASPAFEDKGLGRARELERTRDQEWPAG